VNIEQELILLRQESHETETLRRKILYIARQISNELTKLEKDVEQIHKGERDDDRTESPVPKL
jgi:hypothetical protein